MAKLSSYRRIYEQDYEGQYQKLVKDLGIPINASFSELYDALNNKLTFSENINCTITSFTVTVDANGTPQNATQFKLASTQSTLSGLFVINAGGAKDASLLPTAGVFVAFKRNDNNVIIQNIKGLVANQPYTIKVIALA